jgi:uncharacterized protein YbjT (DUF2867 family)
VRAGVRDPSRAGLPAGAEPVELDFTKPETFGPALEGVRGVYLVRPPQIARVGKTLNRFVDVAAAAGVDHVVLLSVEEAEKSERIPHRQVELHLEKSPLRWTFLRPNHFAQNLIGPYLGDVRRGRIRLPAGDGRAAFVDTRDLAEVARKALLDPDAHAGKAYRLTGPEAASFAEIAALVSEATARDVRYEPVSIPAYAVHLRRTAHAGLVRIAVLSFLHAGIRKGTTAEVDPTLGELLGRPPRTVRDVVNDYRELLAG